MLMKLENVQYVVPISEIISSVCLHCNTIFNTKSTDQLSRQPITGQHEKIISDVITHFLDKMKKSGYVFSNEIKTFYLDKCHSENLKQTKVTTFYHKLNSTFDREGHSNNL